MTTPTACSSQALACNMAAIDTEARTRYHELRDRLMAATRERRELPDGYAFRIAASDIALSEAAEWMEMERQCCPFLTIQLEVSGAAADWWLRLSGPPGAKAVLAAELAP